MGISLLSASRNTTTFITIDESLSQSEANYFVYFWQENCHYCEEIEPMISSYQTDGDWPLYVVDMQVTENLTGWYDWEQHHEEKDKIIGEVIDDELHYFEDPNLYLEDANIQWEIKTVGSDVVAVHQTAHYQPNPTTIAEINIPATPALLEVSQGEPVELVVGANQVTEQLK